MNDEKKEKKNPKETGNPDKGAGNPKPSKEGKGDADQGDAGGAAPAISSALIEAAARVSFFERLGVPYNQEFTAVPALMRICWWPTMGPAVDESSPINVASGFNYRTTRAANSGARNYAKSDQTLVDTCVDSLICFFLEIARIYALCFKYSAYNTYVGRRLVEALGYDYDDLIAHLPQLNFYLNLLGEKISKLAMIPTFNFHKAHQDLAKTVYCDGENEKSQMYVFQQEAYYSYEVVDQVKGVTAVVWAHNDTTLVNESHTYNDIVAMGDRLYNALADSDDCFLIMGDMVKAFGESARPSIATIPMDVEITFTKSDHMLTAINNAVIVPIKTLRYVDAQGKLQMEYDVYTTNSAAEFINELAADDIQTLDRVREYVSMYEDAVGERVINTVIQQPDPATVAEMTRFTVAFSYRADDTTATGYGCVSSINLDAFGTEVISSIEMFAEHTENAEDSNSFRNMYGAPWMVHCGSHSTPMVSIRSTECMFQEYNTLPSQTVFQASAQSFLLAGILANFDWHPAIRVVFAQMSENMRINFIKPVALPLVDYENYARVPNTVLSQIHTARTFAEAGI